MGDISKLWCYIAIIIIIGGLVGCNAVKEKEILSIKLECTNLCEKMENPPFTEKTFKDANEIKTFVKAINRAKEMKGKLVLNIEDEEGRTGLLVDTAKSERGYSISEGLHSKLRRIIYTSSS